MRPWNRLEEAKAESDAVLEDELGSDREKVERGRHGGYGGSEVGVVEEFEEGNAGIHGPRGRWDPQADVADGVFLGVALPSVG